MRVDARHRQPVRAGLIFRRIGKEARDYPPHALREAGHSETRSKTYATSYKLALGRRGYVRIVKLGRCCSAAVLLKILAGAHNISHE
jgi:hypothetical protein